MKRLTEIDVLRGIASMAVCLFHFSMVSSQVILPLSLFRYGSSGVDLFFVISGFVIYMSLTNCKNLSDFWFLRFIRLFPSYWLSIIIAIISFNLIRSSMAIPTTVRYVIGNLFMIQPLMKSGYLSDAYWTLYVELCFYVMISAIWLFKLFDKIENIVLMGLVSVLVINSLYLLLGASSGTYTRFFIVARNVLPLISYFGFFGAGIIYYRVYANGWTARRIFLLLFSFLLTILIHNLSGQFHLFYGTFERVICGAVINILFVFVASKKTRFLNVKLMSFIGTVSYALYLIHSSLGMAAYAFLKKYWGGEAAIILSLLLVVAISALITYYFEKPLQIFLRRTYFGKNKLQASEQK